MGAAKAWATWEASCATLRLDPAGVARFTSPHRALALARIEAHYFVNKGFIAENQILDNMERLADIPGHIIHGRYDMLCPLDNATSLHRTLAGLGIAHRPRGWPFRRRTGDHRLPHKGDGRNRPRSIAGQASPRGRHER